MALSEQQIKVGAKWWADKLRAPKFINGDSSLAGQMATTIAVMNHESADEEAARKFELALTVSLKQVEREYFTLDVDYEPDDVLWNALEAAGIKVGMTTLPWKTNMDFSNGGVTVSCGYGGPWEVLLGKGATQ